MEADGLTFHVSRAMLWGLGFYATLISIAVISLLIPDIRNILKGGFFAIVSKLGLDQISPTLAAFGILLWVTIFSILLLGFPWLLLQAVFDAPPVNAQEIGERRWLLVSLTALVAALGAVVALPFTLIKTRQNERQTRATEEGLITDRINKAVEGLGSEKKIDRIGRLVTRPKAGGGEEITIEWRDKPIDGAVPVEGAKWEVFSETRPNLEVRIGAILALERLARNNLDIHVQIMEILCAYIRENAPARDAKSVAKFEIYEDGKGKLLKKDWSQRVQVLEYQFYSEFATLKPREDIQVVLTVLGRRSAVAREREARGNDLKSQASFVFDEGREKNISEGVVGLINRGSFNAWLIACDNYSGYRLDLRGVNLQGANLARFNLSGARLDGSCLQFANFRGAQLRAVSMNKAKMHGAKFAYACMHGANLSESLMQFANFHDAQMQRAIFDESWMQRSFFRKTQLHNSKFEFSHMQGAIFSQAQLKCSDFYMARMEGASFIESEAQGASFGGAQMCDADFTHVQLNSASLVNSDLRNAKLNDTNMENANLSKARIKNAKFVSANLLRAKFDDADLSNSDFYMAKLNYTSFSKSKLFHTIFYKAELLGADFSDAEFDDTTHLKDSNLKYAAVKGVDFSNAAQIREHLTDIFGDVTTQLPIGIRRPSHWSRVNLGLHFESEWRKWQNDPEMYVPPKSVPVNIP
ncbi:MAG: pentapeptide repeat-containing protein [Alphaproteobacteria bacterium]|nr:pentapeptide repeat-containing protein [Alphaproteobacteria bacterium]